MTGSVRRRPGSGRLLLVGLALVLVAGCAAGDDRPEAVGAEATTAADTTGSLSGDELAAAERIAGRYAHYDVVAYEGSGMKTLIISYGFTDLDVVDGRLVEQETFCSADHRSDQPISVRFSDAATQAIRPVPVDAELSVEDGRARVVRPATPTGIGVDLADPVNDPLPTDPADPRVRDDDGDGRPGVTATISAAGGAVTGELYLARREIFAYDLAEQSDGTLTGVVRDDSEQLVVGASNEVFRTPAQWDQHPDLTRSPIVLVRVGRDWDCDRLMAERPTLLPPVPTIDW